jgi:hypothetical protein
MHVPEPVDPGEFTTIIASLTRTGEAVCATTVSEATYSTSR